MMLDSLSEAGFTEEQKQYLDGFVAGGGIRHALNVLPTWHETLAGAAQPRPYAEEKNLTAEEKAKRNLNGLDTWELVDTRGTRLERLRNVATRRYGRR